MEMPWESHVNGMHTSTLQQLTRSPSASEPGVLLVGRVDGGGVCLSVPMPNVMAALSNIGGGLSSMPQSLADAHY